MSRLIDADEIEKLVKSDNPMHHEQVSIYAFKRWLLLFERCQIFLQKKVR